MPQILSTIAALTDSRRLPDRFGAPLRPFIFGSQAGLHRYAQASEKSLISLGAYNYLDDETYAYPDRATDSTVDQNYVKLYLDNARLKYFERYVGSGIGGLVTPVSGYSNRVRASNLTFKSSTNVLGTSYPRSATYFYDRDVEVGDVVFVRGTVASVTYELWTSVLDFAYEQLTAAIAGAYADDNNDTTQSESLNYNQTQNGLLNDVGIISANDSAYDGTPTGDITETYTVTVIQASQDSDATTARFRVRSASGNDDQASVVPAAFNSSTYIGTRGLKVTWKLINSPLSVTGASDVDFLVGQQWVITVKQAFTAPTATSGGTPISGMPTTTYIIRVSRGGRYISATPPQITVSTTTGVDVSGPTNVTAAAVPVNVGGYGVTIKFNQTALSSGDIYYIPVTGVQNGAARTLILNKSLPSGLLTATDLDLLLHIEQDGFLVTENRVPSPPDVNYEATEDDVTVKEGLTVYESSWTDDGTPLPLPVVSGDLYLEYREWLAGLCGQIIDIFDINTVSTVLGTVHPDNPLAYAVYKALLNTGLTNLSGQQRDMDIIKCSAICGDPDTSANWNEILNVIAGMEDIYYLVPLTTSATVQALVATHCTSQSTSEVGSYRACILNARATTVQEVRVLDDNNVTLLVTIVEDPGDNGNFNQLFNEDGLANWITSGVRAGDIVRFQFTTDGFGEETWSEYVVKSVDSENTLTLEDNDLVAPVGVAQKVEIWRNLSKSEIASDLTDQAESFSDSRVILVWPDTIGDGAIQVSGYYLCAAIAGLAGSVVPHQGLSNVEVLGFDSVSRSTSFFTGANLEALSTGGVLVVTQLPGAGSIYIRRAWTTNIDSVTTREEMVRRDLDGVAFQILDAWSQYIGNANNTEGTLNLMRGDFSSTMGSLKASSFTTRLGSMVDSGAVNSLRSHTVLADKAVALVTVTGPFPLNQVQLSFVI